MTHALGRGGEDAEFVLFSNHSALLAFPSSDELGLHPRDCVFQPPNSDHRMAGRLSKQRGPGRVLYAQIAEGVVKSKDDGNPPPEVPICRS